SSCASRSPGATICPRASLASCPARKSSAAPPCTRMPWLNPRGAARPDGLMICFVMQRTSCFPLPSSNLAPRERWLFFGDERLVEDAVVRAEQQQCLRLCLGFDGGDQVHRQLVVEHALGHRERRRRPLGEPPRPLVGRGEQRFMRHYPVDQP